MKNNNLTREEKITALAHYLNKYIDSCISKYTNNKDLLEVILNDNTLMSLVYESYQREQANINNIKVELELPFDREYHNFNSSTEINHILYDLLISD